MLIVTKFGGTSVGDIEKIENVAEIIAEHVNHGHRIVVVVSAMSGTTDQIYNNLCKISNGSRNLKEFDQAMVTGEQISASLLSIALNNIGLKSISYNAQSLPIYAEGDYSDGYITHINSDKLKDNLQNNIVPVITGFQGFKKTENSFITLGRGGSDYSAVMIAASINADSCYIYTDVDGVYTADPKIVPNAIKISELSYDEMISISSDGAKVLQTKSVLAGKKYNIPIEVLSSFNNQIEGTSITNASFLKRKSNLKIVSYNPNLFLVKDQILSSNLCYDILEKTPISKITIMSLNPNEQPVLAEVEDILKAEKIKIILSKSESNKITIIVEFIVELKLQNQIVQIVQILHNFYNYKSINLDLSLQSRDIKIQKN